MFLRKFCSWGQSFISIPQVVLELQKKLFCFSKVTDTRNLVLLKSVKFQKLGDFTRLAIKKCPQNSFWWGFHLIFYIDFSPNHTKFTFIPICLRFCKILALIPWTIQKLEQHCQNYTKLLI